jgi:two-component system phosphate regulon sensor histidine kinase PhoR
MQLKNEPRDQELRQLLAELEQVRSELADLVAGSPSPVSDGLRDRISGEVEWLKNTLKAEVKEGARQRAFARAMMQATPNGVVLLNNQAVILEINPSANELLAIRSDPVGKTPLQAVPIFEIHQSVDLLLKQQQGGEFRCASGVYDLMGYLTRVDELTIMLVLTDITRFNEAQRARSDFVANVSHELRTPMTAIMGYTETLMVDIDRVDQDLIPLIDTIYRNSRRLRDLFEDLLELYRIESRGDEPILEHTLLLPVLAESVVSAADNAQTNGQDFSLECDDRLKGWINPEALSAIIGNLTSNACSYTGEGGAIVVRAEKSESGEVSIHVCDNGIGIDSMHHERIFERFFRVDGGRSRRAGGTGLGLAIVKHLSQACNAVVSVESTPGQGTTFTVRLPSHV